MSSTATNLLAPELSKLVNPWENPQFYRHQTVSFLGGIGKIKRIEKQALGWTYHVEMSMGIEPDFGRVGAETTIVLEEQELRPLEQMGLTISPVKSHLLEQKYYNRSEVVSCSYSLEWIALKQNGRG